MAAHTDSALQSIHESIKIIGVSRILRQEPALELHNDDHSLLDKECIEGFSLVFFPASVRVEHSAVPLFEALQKPIHVELENESPSIENLPSLLFRQFVAKQKIRTVVQLFGQQSEVNAGVVINRSGEERF